jgi:hypothetical protein
MNARRLTLMAFAVLTALGMLVLVLTAPSQADPKKLLVANSATGPFQTNLAHPLFEGSGPFVPLDQVSNAFYVKNNSSQPARVTVQVVNRGTTNDFEGALTFDVNISGTQSTGSAPETGSPGCHLVTTGPNIAPGAVQKVDVGLAVADLQQQIGMDQAASLDFVVTLSQVGPKGQIQVCGAQATAQPAEVKGEQATAGQQGQCAKNVVVTVAGQPTCVPTAVDAGLSYDEPRSPAEVGSLAILLMCGGATLMWWGNRRRRRDDALA